MSSVQDAVEIPPTIFSSAEVRSLSVSRTAALRLPDLLHEEQRKHSGQLPKQIGDIFVAYIQESEFIDPDGLTPLTITNEVDSEPCPSADFCYTDEYILNPSLPHELLPPGIPPGCQCPGDECDPKTCECAKIGPNVDATYSREEFKKDSFAYLPDGKLAPGPRDYPGTPIWECTPWCGCSDLCPNRVVQKGRKVPIDLFKTKDGRGWGIRALVDLQQGTFVTHYAGELLSSDEDHRRSLVYEQAMMSYVLDVDAEIIGRYQFRMPYDRKIIAEEGEAGRLRLEKWKEQDLDGYADTAAEEAPEEENLFSCDAGQWGNISRYYNSSCEPTMRVHPVYLASRDIRRPYMCFFTAGFVPAKTELTFKYSGDNNDPVPEQDEHELRAKLVAAPEGTNLKIRTGLSVLGCKCGTPTCGKLLYRIDGKN